MVGGRGVDAAGDGLDQRRERLLPQAGAHQRPHRRRVRSDLRAELGLAGDGRPPLGRQRLKRRVVERRGDADDALCHAVRAGGTPDVGGAGGPGHLDAELRAQRPADPAAHGVGLGSRVDERSGEVDGAIIPPSAGPASRSCTRWPASSRRRAASVPASPPPTTATRLTASG